jgi:cold shock CspA family protein
MSNKHVRETGRVTYWNTGRGYGFIEQAAEGHSFFAHVSDWCEDDADPHPGERISFVVGSGNKDPCAKSIMRAAV